MQLNDGIMVLTVPIAAVCRCGEQLAAGERAGFDTERDEVVCLRCLADRKAGRCPPTHRPQPAADGAPMGPVAPVAPVAPVLWLDSRRGSSGPGGRSPRHFTGRSTRRSGGGPRTTTTLLIALVVVALVLGTAVVLRSAKTGLLVGSRTSDDPSAYALLLKPTRAGLVTWDPCLPIQLVVNSAAAPRGSDALLAEAVERVNQASGLRLEVLGPTAQAPQPSRTERELSNGRPGSGRAPVLVAWTTPDVVPGLKGSIVGLGGAVQQLGGSLDRARYIGGAVSLDGPQLAKILREPNGHARARAVVMHELGHLLGLDHVDNPAEVMHASGGHVTEFGQGDVAGLTLLGSGGCPYDTTPDSTT